MTPLAFFAVMGSRVRAASSLTLHTLTLDGPFDGSQTFDPTGKTNLSVAITARGGNGSSEAGGHGGAYAEYAWPSSIANTIAITDDGTFTVINYDGDPIIWVENGGNGGSGGSGPGSVFQTSNTSGLTLTNAHSGGNGAAPGSGGEPGTAEGDGADGVTTLGSGNPGSTPGGGGESSFFGSPGFGGAARVVFSWYE